MKARFSLLKPYWVANSRKDNNIVNLDESEDRDQTVEALGEMLMGAIEGFKRMGALETIAIVVLFEED